MFFFDHLHDPWQAMDHPLSWLPGVQVSSPVQAPLQQDQSILTNACVCWGCCQIFLEIVMVKQWTMEFWGYSQTKPISHICKYTHIIFSAQPKANPAALCHHSPTWIGTMMDFGFWFPFWTIIPWWYHGRRSKSEPSIREVWQDLFWQEVYKRTFPALLGEALPF